MFVTVLGIDPGLTRCGYGLVRQEPSKKLEFLNAGVFSTSPQEQLSTRLAEIHQDIVALIDEVSPDQIGIERVFFKANVSTALSVAQVSGLVHSIAASRSIPVYEYSPTQIKNSICGDGQADKLQIQTMVAKLLGLNKVPQPADAADALAIAITHLGVLKPGVSTTKNAILKTDSKENSEESSEEKNNSGDSAIYNGSNLHNAIADAIARQGRREVSIKKQPQKRDRTKKRTDLVR